MKSIIVVILLFLFSSCQREDVIFSASDELHSLQLYSSNHEFEILHNGFNTAKGTYELLGDTLIFLTYNKDETIPNDNLDNQSANEVLPRYISIDRSSKRIRTIDDGRSFCADIHIDQLIK
jgi:hypothetical protein